MHHCDHEISNHYQHTENLGKNYFEYAEIYIHPFKSERHPAKVSSHRNVSSFLSKCTKFDISLTASFPLNQLLCDHPQAILHSQLAPGGFRIERQGNK